MIKWHFVFFSLLLSTQSVLACDDVENLVVASDEEALEVPPKREMRLTHGKPYKICNAFFRGIREHGLVVPGYCGVPLPSDDPDFSLPIWRPVDPIDHMDVVRSATIMANFNRSNGGVDIEIRRKRSLRFFGIKPHTFPTLNVPRKMGDDFPKEEIIRFWTPYKTEILNKIAAEEIQMWVVNIDTDFDGKKEHLYRMTQIVVEGAPEPEDKIWQDPHREQRKYFVSTMYPHCQNRGVTEDNNSYYYFVSKEDSPSANRHLFSMGMGLSHMDVFLWQKRVFYFGGGGSVIESRVLKPEQFNIDQMGMTGRMVTVCSFGSKLISNQE